MPTVKFQPMARKKLHYLFQFYSSFFKLYSNTPFQHLIHHHSIIVLSSDALSSDDYLPDLVDEVEPDGNEIR